VSRKLQGWNEKTVEYHLRKGGGGLEKVRRWECQVGWYTWRKWRTENRAL